MPLPKIDQPIFELTLPSTGKKVKYRPFTVKEEKILLIAQESKELDQMVLSIKQILGNCLQNFDVDDLAIFDLEYLLLNVRAKAVNNKLEFKIKDPDTEEEVDIELDIGEIEIKRNENHKNIIKISDSIYLKMSYPGIDYLKHLKPTEEGDTAKALFDLMSQCIDSVVQGEEVYKLKDFNHNEIEDFFDSLGSDVISKIREFFDTIPKLSYEHKYTNKNGVEKTFVVEGTETFFI
jgi:hypothetical protein